MKIDVLEIDVSSDESVRDAMIDIPPVDVLVNNAGRGFGGPVEGFSSEECLAQLDLNIVGNIRRVYSDIAQNLMFFQYQFNL